MKRLLALILFMFLWATPVEAAVLWESYSDSTRLTVSNNFTASGAIVFMKGTGLAKNKTYRSTFYDAQNNTVLIHDGQSDNNGVFLSQMRPSDYPASTPGVWSAKLERISGGTQLVGTDTFTVQASAIPEFETVFATVWVVFIIGLTYWLMKRRVK